MCIQNKPTDSTRYIEVELPTYLIREIEAFLQTEEARTLGLATIDDTIAYIILDWIDKVRELSKSKINTDKS